MKEKKIKRVFLLFMILITSVTLNSQNLLANGDFESGGSGVGFYVHDYTLINPLTGTSTPGTYARTTNPSLMNSTYISSGDHTTGSGNMLVVDGATLNNRFFWTTGDTGGAINGFTPGTTYTFTYWIKSVSNAVTTDVTTRANIGVFFVNATAINPTGLNNLAPLPSEGWQSVSYSFVATANNIMIRLQTLNVGTIGCDFAVDDFSITQGGLPLLGSYTAINPTCPNSTDGSVTVNLIGGTFPYGTYHLTGTSTQSSANGIFTGLGAGTYTVSVFDADGNQYEETNIVLSASNDLQLNATTATICPGETVTLNVTGGDGSYAWTANPPDSSITNPNAAIQNITPAVTTTYTVTSGSVSSSDNLVVNGDFSQGNIGFTTGYTQITNPNPYGVQASYDIVTDPNAWFTAFASCGDHTTGMGNMMVFDGSTDSTKSVWCNANSITVQSNTDYTFSYYVATVAAGSPARLEVLVNGISLGNPVMAPSSTCMWTLVSHNWNSGTNTIADICIFNRETSSGGNDFALDDISLTETVTCLYQKSITITVDSSIIPTFTSISPICSGASLEALPTTSLNGITGTWLPALNNTVTTEYEFTPDGGQCAAKVKLTIVVNQPATPTFDAIAPICSGDVIALPSTSLNGITGTWLPALNNTATTTYTFTPDAGQCATTAELTIVVNQPAIPTFDAIAPICSGGANPLLTVSENGISGTWSPAFNSTATTQYEFTADGIQCATKAYLTVEVIALPTVTVTQGCIGNDYTLTAVESGVLGTTYTWHNPAGNQISTDQSIIVADAGAYKLVITQNGCSEEEIVTVTDVLCTQNIQKGISANGDGYNDNFELSNLSVKRLEIFNRYGMKVYSKSDYTNQWYGQSDKGEELPDGTYYYVINRNNGENITGWIYINREQ